MKLPGKTLLKLSFLLLLLLPQSYVPAFAEEAVEAKSDKSAEVVPSDPVVADIVPLSSQLAGQLADLENSTSHLLDVAVLEQKFARLQKTLQRPAAQLESLKKSKNFRYQNLLDLREAIKLEEKELDAATKPLQRVIGQLGQWREEWLAEKERWSKWQSSATTGGDLSQLRPTFSKAHKNIGSALDIIRLQLDSLLILQKKAGNLTEEINGLVAQLDGLILETRRETLHKASPSLFSLEFLSQLGTGTWSGVLEGIANVSFPGKRFLARHGWIIIIQIILICFVVGKVYQNRRVVRESKRWHFLAERPFAAGLFIGGISTMFIYVYEGAPAVWKLANVIVASVAFARLAGGLVEELWKRQLINGTVSIMIGTRLLYLLSVPVALTRLYVFITSFFIMFFALGWVKKWSRSDAARVNTWFLGGMALLCASVLVAELRGHDVLSLYLLESFVNSIGIICVFKLIMYFMHGCLEWLFPGGQLQQAAGEETENLENVVVKISGFLDLLFCVFSLVPVLMMTWRIYDNLESAMKGLLNLSFSVGAQTYSVSLIILSVCIFYVSFLVSSIVQKLLMDEVIISRPLAKGVRLSISRLLHYVIILVGFLIALATIGFEVSQLTIIMSALGVGIGFGMQNIVNNFISGLILLFERPVRVGDTVEIAGKWAEIKSIGLRATIIQTLDQADVIIPNADLITNQVTNWTLSNRQVRLTVPVGVAYGSNIPLVMEKLIESANAIPLVATKPAPQALFLKFGDSSLDFEVRVWVLDADERITVISELHQQIDENFRETGIEIAFPQRDLHIRSADESLVLQPSKST